MSNRFGLVSLATPGAAVVLALALCPWIAGAQQGTTIDAGTVTTPAMNYPAEYSNSGFDFNRVWLTWRCTYQAGVSAWGRKMDIIVNGQTFTETFNDPNAPNIGLNPFQCGPEQWWHTHQLEVFPYLQSRLGVASVPAGTIRFALRPEFYEGGSLMINWHADDFLVWEFEAKDFSIGWDSQVYHPGVDTVLFEDNFDGASKGWTIANTRTDKGWAIDGSTSGAIASTANPYQSAPNSLNFHARTSAPPPTQGPDSPSSPTPCPYPLPTASDTVFVTDLTPTMTYRSAGPITFSIDITRVAGHKNTAGFLLIAAFDVDAGSEKDLVLLNGTPVFGDKWSDLGGSNGGWYVSIFPIDDGNRLNLPADPGVAFGTPTPARNEVSISVDAGSSQDTWATAVDWAALVLNTPRPVLMVHGTASTPVIWSGKTWDLVLTAAEIPHDVIDVQLRPIGWIAGTNTISVNASFLDSVIPGLLTRWGVRKINILSHSKGGLDSRHYAQNRDTVETIIQLGTPNAGTPLATGATEAAIAIIGEGGVAYAFLHGGPGVMEQSIGEMSLYNSKHPLNPSVLYVALSGEYRTGDAYEDSYLDGAFGSANDTVVPVWSVHFWKRPNVRHLYHSSTASNQSAMHTHLHTDEGGNAIPGMILYYIFNPRTSASDLALGLLGREAPAREEPTAVTVGTAGGQVAQGATNSHAVVIDATSRAGFWLLYPSGDLDLTLASPSGTTIDPTAAAADPTLAFGALEEAPGQQYEFYAVQNPQPGTWTLRVTGKTVADPSGQGAYAVWGTVDSPSIQLTASTSAAGYSASSPVIVTATVKSGTTPVTDATVSGQAVLPDLTAAAFALADSGTGDDAAAGDGVYSGRLTSTTQTGVYRLRIDASRAGGSPFGRVALLTTTVASSTTTLSATYSDAGNDTDGDGSFDDLVIRVGVNVSANGTYSLAGTLDTPAGTVVTDASFQGALSAGAQTVELRFSGGAIFRSGLNGPYRLASVVLLESGDLFLAQATNAYTTAAYSFRDFDHPMIYVPGTGTDTGQDADADSAFDTLEIQLNVELDAGGAYTWSGRLVDSNDSAFETATGSGTLAVGSNTLRFAFDGGGISSRGVDGPYFLDDVMVQGPSAVDVQPRAYQTQAYKATQFEASGTSSAGADSGGGGGGGGCGAGTLPAGMAALVALALVLATFWGRRAGILVR